MEQKAEEIMNLLKENYPEADTFLRYQNCYQFLVAVILSARSTDEQVNRVSKGLFQKYPNVFELAEASPEEVAEVIKGCGLYRSKSSSLIKMARTLVLEYGGKIPSDWNKLLSLPGVGRKTASLVWATLFGFPAFPVDTHVFRVARRLGLSRGEKVEEVEKELKECFPSREWLPLHHRLILHGRKLCYAKQPHCEKCFLQGHCVFLLKQS